MKKKVLVDLSITCEPPSHIGRYAKTLEDKAKQLEDWCKDFEWFMRDHRSQDPVSLNVERQYEEQCSYCGSAWEVDEEGRVAATKRPLNGIRIRLAVRFN